MTLDAKIEAILFFKGESLTIKKLMEIFSATESDVISALDTLSVRLETTGLSLMRKDDEVMLGTNPGMDEIIRKMIKEDLEKELTKAGLETLATIIYHGPISRSRIDYIRGVNSSFILRNLMIRGLVERISDPKDERSYLYKPTFDLLRYLGISKIEDMPEFGKIKQEIEENIKNVEINSDGN